MPTTYFMNRVVWASVGLFFLLSHHYSIANDINCIRTEEISLEVEAYNQIKYFTRFHPDLPMFNCFVQQFVLDECGDKHILERKLAFSREESRCMKFYGDYVDLFHDLKGNALRYEIQSGNGYTSKGILLLENQDVIRHETASSCAGASECFTITTSWLNEKRTFYQKEPSN